MSDEERRARAAARRDRITLRRTRVGLERGGDEAPVEDTPERRFALVVSLTRAAWAMSGRPWPDPGAARSIVRFVPRSAG